MAPHEIDSVGSREHSDYKSSLSLPLCSYTGQSRYCMFYRWIRQRDNYMLESERNMGNLNGEKKWRGKKISCYNKNKQKNRIKGQHRTGLRTPPVVFQFAKYSVPTFHRQSHLPVNGETFWHTSTLNKHKFQFYRVCLFARFEWNGLCGRDVSNETDTHTALTRKEEKFHLKQGQQPNLTLEYWNHHWPTAAAMTRERTMEWDEFSVFPCLFVWRETHECEFVRFRMLPRDLHSFLMKIASSERRPEGGGRRRNGANWELH